MSMIPDPAVVENLDAFYQRQVTHLVEKLRRTAQSLEDRREVRPHLRDSKLDYDGHARQIIHEIVWAFANLHIEGLLSAATEADRYVREQS